jgi:hypothetical protein
MSTLPHILPTADPGSSRAGGEQPNISTAAPGVAGLFSDLMAQALSPVMPASNDSIPTPGQTTADINGKSQPLLPAQPAKTAILRSGKLELQFMPSQEMAGNSIVAAIATGKPDGQSSAIQSGSQTTDKSDRTSKTEKSSQPQAVQPGVNPILNELLINQILAGTISAVSPSSTSPVNLQLNPISSPPERIATTGENVASLVVAAKTVKSSGTFVGGSSLSLPENEAAAESQPSGAPAASQSTEESSDAAAKIEQNSVLPDALANVLQAKPAVTSAEHPSVNESSSDGQPVAQPSPDINGIPIAKQDLSVKQAEKTNNIAGQTEKVLPGSVAFVAQANTRLQVASHPDQVGATALVNSDALENSIAASPAIHSAATVSGSNLPAVERMQEMVTLNAVRLSDSGNNSMQVVIKPDSGTQLSLELRMGAMLRFRLFCNKGIFIN